MPSVPEINAHGLALLPRIRAALSACSLAIVVVLLVCPAVTAGAADRVVDNPLHDFFLQPGLNGVVDTQGGLVFLMKDARVPLLRAELLPREDSRRQRNGDQFHAVVSEGVPGGRRGFSDRADDDQDGQTDEDQLDGRDNDGDGKVDEDFAAIGDAMVAVHLKDITRDGGIHLEYYHWTHSHLSSAVFLNVGGGGTKKGSKSYVLRSEGSDWLETGTSPVVHSVAGEISREGLRAFVCRIDLADDPAADPCAPGSYRWLGVMILADNPAKRFRHEGDRIELPLGNKSVPVVICVADTWLQLNRILGESQNVYEGMTDPVDNRTSPWIVPAVCSTCRAAEAPEFNLETGADGALVLNAEIAPGQCGLLDPDLFRLNGHPLGAPESISWRPFGGTETILPWNCLTTDLLKENGSAVPFSKFSGLRGHGAEGRLTFVFSGTGEMVKATGLAGRYLDGRHLNIELEVEVPAEAEAAAGAPASLDPEPEAVEDTARGYAEERARLLDRERGNLSLSPELLVGWPNPFSDNINIRFTVPQTMKEAFVWTDKDNQPAEIDLEGDVPWPGGRPGVSVKIYNINGQELVTLHSANEGVGEYTVHWNGTDAYGRKVASGPYFCKLQMDDWSVTRQVVFLR